MSRPIGCGCLQLVFVGIVLFFLVPVCLKGTADRQVPQAPELPSVAQPIAPPISSDESVQAGDQIATELPGALSAPIPESNHVDLKYSVGEEVELVGPKEGPVRLTATEEIYDRLKSGKIQFQPGKELFGVPLSSLARITSVKFDRVQVQIIGTNWKGRVGWIATSEIRRPPKEGDDQGELGTGFSIIKRRAIYSDIFRAGMLAYYELEWRYPYLLETTTTPADVEAYLKEREKVSKSYKTKNLTEVGRKYKVDLKFLQSIDEEGTRERWPMPEVENPFKGKPRPAAKKKGTRGGS